jgi:hypothetical protein
MTTVKDGADKPNGNQLYPMFSVLEFEHETDNTIKAINIKLCRVTGIFAKDAADSFTQISYGSRPIGIVYLIEVNDDNEGSINQSLTGDNVITKSEYMYGAWVNGSKLGENKYLYIQY